MADDVGTGSSGGGGGSGESDRALPPVGVLPAARPADAGPNPDGETPEHAAARLARAACHVQVAWHKKWKSRGPSAGALRAFFAAAFAFFSTLGTFSSKPSHSACSLGPLWQLQKSAPVGTASWWRGTSLYVGGLT